MLGVPEGVSVPMESQGREFHPVGRILRVADGPELIALELDLDGVAAAVLADPTIAFAKALPDIRGITPDLPFMHTSS